MSEEKSQFPPENPPPYPPGYGGGYPAQAPPSYSTEGGAPSQQPPYPPPQQQGYPPQQQGYPQQSYPAQQGGYAPMGAQTAQPQANVVYVQPAQPLAHPPSDYLCFNIFVTICCCWPIGIIAILKSVETREAINRGDAPRATSAAAQAKKFGIITLVVGILMVVISMVIVGIYIGLIMANIKDDPYNYNN